MEPLLEASALRTTYLDCESKYHQQKSQLNVDTSPEGIQEGILCHLKHADMADSHSIYDGRPPSYGEATGFSLY